MDNITGLYSGKHFVAGKYWKMPERKITGAEKYRFGYQGQFAEEDEETGLNHFEARLWDSRLGRWLTTDPAGQYASPYLGMGNNPISGVDPDGEKKVYYNADATYSHTTHNNWWHNLLFGIQNFIPTSLGGHRRVSVDYFWNTFSKNGGGYYTGEVRQWNLTTFNKIQRFRGQPKNNLQDVTLGVLTEATYGTADNFYVYATSILNEHATHMDGSGAYGKDLFESQMGAIISAGSFAAGKGLSSTAKTLKSTPTLYNNFAKKTAGQFKGPNHATLRATEYKDVLNYHNSKIIHEGSFGYKVIQGGIDFAEESKK